MSDKKDAEQAKAPTPRELFEGIKGRPPKTDQELAATMFESASTDRWGEGRS